MKSHRKLLGLLSVFAIFVAACSVDAPMAPSRVADLPVAVASSSDGSASSADEARYDSLKTQRDSIRAAAQRRRDAEKALLDSLKREWKKILENAKVSKELDEQWIPTLLQCEPLPYAADAEIIGPKGGTLQIGPHRIEIPAGALTRDELITGESESSLLVGVKFGPHGLRFLHSASLYLSYQHCVIPPSLRMQVVYVGDDYSVLETPRSADDRGNDQVQGWVDHFSSYMIAY